MRVTVQSSSSAREMASVLFAALLILVSSVTIASSLQCYKCVREDKPDADKYCEITNSSQGNNTIVNCTAGDNRCIITKMVTKDNSVTQFRRDCGKQAYCTNKCTKPDVNGTVVCDSCCEKNLCNKDSGPEPATPTERPITATTPTPATTPTAPTPAEKSGTSRIVTTRGLYALGGFLMWFVL